MRATGAVWKRYGSLPARTGEIMLGMIAAGLVIYAAERSGTPREKCLNPR